MTQQVSPRAVYILFLSAICLSGVLVSAVTAQLESVWVLSYTWYIRPSDGYMMVVGEVQNVGTTILYKIGVNVTRYNADGVALDISVIEVMGTYILPQQKVPFKVPFPPLLGYSQVDRIKVEVYEAVSTEEWQYPDLTLINEVSYLDENGYFTVEGTVQNNGSETAQGVSVLGTFYYAGVIQVGSSDTLNPTSLAPGETATFKIVVNDSDPELTSQITDYALLIQTEWPIIPEFPTISAIGLCLVAVTVVLVFYRWKIKRIYTINIY